MNQTKCLFQLADVHYPGEDVRFHVEVVSIGDQSRGVVGDAGESHVRPCTTLPVDRAPTHVDV